MENQELQLITQRFDAVTTLMNTQFKGINERLDKINGRVGKTEDEIQMILVERGITTEKQKKGLKELDELYLKVEELDNKERNHVAVCPVVPRLGELNNRVRVLEDGSLATITRKNLVWSTITVVGILIGIMIGSIQINDMLRTKETDKIMQTNDTIMRNQAIIFDIATEVLEKQKEAEQKEANKEKPK